MIWAFLQFVDGAEEVWFWAGGGDLQVEITESSFEEVMSLRESGWVGQRGDVPIRL